MENTQKNDNKKVLVIALFAVLAVVIGVLVYMNIQKSEEIETKEQTIELKDKELNGKLKEMESLKQELEAIRAEKEQMGISNDSLNAQIENLNSMIKNLKTNQSASVSQRKQMDAAISKLKKERDEHLIEIEALKAKNDSLNSDVETLKTEKTRMSGSIDSMSTTNKELASKVAIASILKVENLKVTIMDAKGKVREGEEFKASKIDKIKAAFNLADNKVAKKNTKIIYFRLIDPSNAALYDLATGGGMFEFEGKSIPYTAKQEIEFANTKDAVSFIYAKGSDYGKGRHNIEIYCEGSKIGEGSFNVK